MSNPYTQVYNALWDLMRAWPAFADTVKAGNRIQFTGKLREIIKAEIAVGDLPEVRLVAVSDTPHLQRTSNSTSTVMTLEWQVSTGDQRLDVMLFPLKWEMFRAMSKWETVLTPLTWNGHTFAKLFRPLISVDGQLESDLIRGIKGWSTIWSCTIEMWFRTLDLQDKDVPS